MYLRGGFLPVKRDRDMSPFVRPLKLGRDMYRNFEGVALQPYLEFIRKAPAAVS